MSADGRWVAYESADQVFCWDAQTGSNVLVSVNADGTGPASGISKGLVLSANGRCVAFLSAATNLLVNLSLIQTDGFQLFVRDLAAQKTYPLSFGASGPLTRFDLDGFPPALSADGQRLAFQSPDSTLALGDLNQASDVFVRDLAAGSIELVSQHAPERPALTSAAHARGHPGSISADGRFATFTACDSNLVPGDTNRWRDVFVRDLTTGMVIPVHYCPGIEDEEAYLTQCSWA